MASLQSTIQPLGVVPPGNPQSQGYVSPTAINTRAPSPRIPPRLTRSFSDLTFLGNQQISSLPINTPTHNTTPPSIPMKPNVAAPISTLSSPIISINSSRASPHISPIRQSPQSSPRNYSTNITSLSPIKSNFPRQSPISGYNHKEMSSLNSISPSPQSSPQLPRPQPLDSDRITNIAINTKTPDYRDILDDNSVESQLIRAGYAPEGFIIVHENEKPICRYIKAIDQAGRTVFIEPDTDGFVCANANNFIMKHTNEASVLPYSIRMGASACAGTDVCGVAWECDGQVCTVKRDDQSLVPTEDTFTIEGTESNKYGLLGSAHIPYTIVRMSEILINPEAVQMGIESAHTRIRNASLASCEEKTYDLLQSVSQLEADLDRYDALRRNIGHVLASTIAQFDQVHHSYYTSSPTADPIKAANEQANLRKIRYNLKVRHEKVEDMIKLCTSINEKKEHIERINTDINDLIAFAEKNFTGLDRVLEE